MTLWESGDILLNGDLYVNSPINSGATLDEGILVNRIDNLKDINKGDILGIPTIIDMEFNFTIEAFDEDNDRILWTGSDRSNTYNNQEITQLEFLL